MLLMYKKEERKVQRHFQMALSHGERAELLRGARKTIEVYLLEEGMVPWEPAGSLREKGGAFVTLEKRGALRGCIGHMAADRPLYLTVQEMAIQAATGDPRFPQVR